VFFFGGASNVQNGGQILSVRYPGAHALHGSEHVIGLYFVDIAKLGPIQVRCFYIYIYMCY